MVLVIAGISAWKHFTKADVVNTLTVEQATELAAAPVNNLKAGNATFRVKVQGDSALTADGVVDWAGEQGIITMRKTGEGDQEWFWTGTKLYGKFFGQNNWQRVESSGASEDLLWVIATLSSMQASKPQDTDSVRSAGFEPAGTLRDLTLYKNGATTFGVTSEGTLGYHVQPSPSSGVVFYFELSQFSDSTIENGPDL